MKKLFQRVSRIVLAIISIVVLIGITDLITAPDDLSTYVGTNSLDLYMTPTTYAQHLGYMQLFDHTHENGTTKIAYIDSGDPAAKTIVLIHGTPTNSWLYRKMIPGLVEAGWRVIAPDMAGFGASQPVDTQYLETGAQARALSALLDSLDIQQATIAGHDQGSLWMQQALMDQPERYTRAILFNGIYDYDGFHPPAGFGESTMTTKGTSRAMGSKVLGRVMAYGAMLGGLSNPRMATTSMINGYLYPLLMNHGETYIHFIGNFGIVEKDVTLFQTQLSNDVPDITVIWGMQDKILRGEDQIPVLQEIYSIQDEDIHRLDQCSHFLQEECADEVVNILTSL